MRPATARRPRAWACGLAAAALAATACAADEGAGTDAATDAGPPPAWTSVANGPDAHGAGTDMTATQAADLRPCWEREVGAVFGAPTVADGTVYALSLDGLWALDAATGEERWHQPDVRGVSSPTLAGDRVVALAGDESTLHAVDRRTGDVEWSTPLATHPLSDGFSSPLVVDGTVVVGQASSEAVSGEEVYSFRGSVAGVDLDTGDLLWRHHTVPEGNSGAGIWTAPSVDVDTGTAFVGTGQNYDVPAGDGANAVQAVDVATGDLRWQRRLLPDDVWATVHPELGWDFDVSTAPLLVDPGGDIPPLVVVGQKSGVLTALDRRTGDVVWQVEAGTGSLQGGIMGNLGLAGDTVLTAANNTASTAPGAEPAEEGAPLDGLADLGNRTPLTPTSVLVAVDVATGERLWERQLSTWVWAPVTTAGEVAFVPVGDRVEVVSTADGRRLHDLPLPHASSGAAAVVGDLVVVGASGAWHGGGRTLHAFGSPCP